MSRGPPPPIPPRPPQLLGHSSGPPALPARPVQSPPPLPSRPSARESAPSPAPPAPSWAPFEWSPLYDPALDRPTDSLRRLADSIFFYLNATCPPLNTNHIDPGQLHHFFKAVNLRDLENPGNLACYAHEAMWTAVGIQFDNIQGMGKSPILGPSATTWDKINAMTNLTMGTVPALTQGGWIHYLDLRVRRDPVLEYTLLSRAVEWLHLLDPATGQPFPPLPREALPAEPEQAAADEWAIAERAGMDAIRLHTMGVNAMANIQVQGAENIRLAAMGPGWTVRHY